MLEILNEIKKATGITPTPFTHKKLIQGIVYTFNNVDDNGAVARDRLDISIIANTLKECVDISSKVDKCLLKPGDNTKFTNVTKIIKSGGGSYNDNASSLNVMVSYYYITRRSLT